MLRTIFDGIYKEFHPIASEIVSSVEEDKEELKISNNKSVNEILEDYMTYSDIDPEIQKKIKSKIEKYKENL